MRLKTAKAMFICANNARNVITIFGILSISNAVTPVTFAYISIMRIPAIANARFVAGPASETSNSHLSGCL